MNRRRAADRWLLMRLAMSLALALGLALVLAGPSAAGEAVYETARYRVRVSDSPPAIVSIEARTAPDSDWVDLLGTGGSASPYGIVRSATEYRPASTGHLRRANDGAELLFDSILTDDDRLTFTWQLDFEETAFTCTFGWRFAETSTIFTDVADLTETGFVLHSPLEMLADSEIPHGPPQALVLVPAESGGLALHVEPVRGVWMDVRTDAADGTGRIMAFHTPPGGASPMGSYEAGTLRFEFVDPARYDPSVRLPRWDDAVGAYVMGETGAAWFEGALAGCPSISARVAARGVTRLFADQHPVELAGPIRLTASAGGSEFDLLPEGPGAQVTVTPGTVVYGGSQTTPAASWTTTWTANNNQTLLLALTELEASGILRPPIVTATLSPAGQSRAPAGSGAETVDGVYLQWITAPVSLNPNRWGILFALGASPSSASPTVSGAIAAIAADATQSYRSAVWRAAQPGTALALESPSEGLNRLAPFLLSGAALGPAVPTPFTHAVSEAPPELEPTARDFANLAFARVLLGDFGGLRDSVSHAAADVLMSDDADERRVGAAAILRMDLLVFAFAAPNFLTTSLAQARGMAVVPQKAGASLAEKALPQLVRGLALDRSSTEWRAVADWAEATEKLAEWSTLTETSAGTGDARFGRAAQWLREEMAVLADAPDAPLELLLAAGRAKVLPEPRSRRESLLLAHHELRNGQAERGLERLLAAVAEDGAAVGFRPWDLPPWGDEKRARPLDTVDQALLVRVLVEGVFGVQFTPEGLLVKPNVPDSWAGDPLRLRFHWGRDQVNLEVHSSAARDNLLIVNGFPAEYGIPIGRGAVQDARLDLLLVR